MSTAASLVFDLVDSKVASTDASSVALLVVMTVASLAGMLVVHLVDS